MELRQLETFRVVARELSFTRAAEELEYSQSSVTAQVQALERDLGQPLFERLGRRVVLTHAGGRLLEYAERMLRLADEARASVAGDEEPAGTLNIGASETLCTYRLPPVLRRFHERCPRVRLVFHPGLCPDIQRGVAAGAYDVGFLLMEPVRPPNLRVEALVDEPLVVLAPPSHPLARRARVLPGDLAGEPVLVTEAGCSYRGMFERLLAAAGVRPEATMEFASVEAIKQCVMAGMGVTLLPEVAVTGEVADGKLAALRWAGPELCVVTQLATHKDKHLSPALRAFLEITRQVLAEPRRADPAAPASAR